MSELPSITEWSETNQITDQREQTIGYGEFLTKHYMDKGELDGHTYSTIQQNMFADLQRQGVPEEEALSMLAPPQLSFEDKAKLVAKSSLLSIGDEGWDEVSNFAAVLSVKDNKYSNGELSPYFEQTYNDAREKAEAVVNSRYNDAARKMVADGLTPYARIEREDGTFMVRGGDAAEGLSAVEAYEKAKKVGTVTSGDLLSIYASQQLDDKGNYMFRQANFYESSAALQNAIQDDSSELGTRISRLAEDIAERGGMDETVLFLAVNDITKSIPEAANIPLKDLEKSVELAAGRAAMSSGLIEFDSENLSNNIRRFGYGQVVLHRDLIASKKLFNTAIQSLPEDEREQVKDSRVHMLTQQFDDYSDVFNNTYVADDWQQALTSGLRSGKKKHEILDEFLSTYDYSEFRNEVIGHIGSSIPDAFTDIIHGVRAMAGSEKGREALLQNMEERQARERLANMFGGDIGMAVDLGAMVAPVLVDVGATALLGASTAGTGAVAWQGTKMGLRGVTRAMMRDVVTATARETAEDVATRNTLKSLAKPAATKKLSEQATKEIAEATSAHSISKTYANLMANKYFTTSAVAVPAFTRSSSMTYASVYSAIENSPEGKEMTPDEIHDKALGAGLTAGAITALITSSFQLVGRGGLEAFIGRGASAAQVKRALEELGRKEFSSNAKFAAVVSEVIDAGSRAIVSKGRLLKSPIFQNFTDEALEEGLDEFANTFVQAYATDEDIRFTDLVANTATAALYGGIFGAGMPVAQRMTSKLMGKGVDVEALQQAQAEQQVDQAIVDRLRATGSEMTAQEVARLRRAAPIRVADDVAADTDTDTDTEADEPAATPAPTPTPAAQATLRAEREAEIIQERLDQIAQQGATTTALQAERAELTKRLDELIDELAPKDLTDAPDQEFEQLVQTELLDQAEGRTPTRSLSETRAAILQRVRKMEEKILEDNSDFATIEEWNAAEQPEGTFSLEGNYLRRMNQLLERVEKQMVADMRANEAQPPATPTPTPTSDPDFLKNSKKITEEEEAQIIDDIENDSNSEDATEEPPLLTPEEEQEIAADATARGEDPQQAIFDARMDAAQARSELLSANPDEGGTDPLIDEDPLLTPDEEALIASDAAQVGEDPEAAVAAARKAAAKKRAEGAGLTTSTEIFDDTPAEPASIKQVKQPLSLAPISYTQNPSFNEETSQTEYSDGEAQIVEMSGRAIVLVNIGGIQMPFYLSTGKAGKKDVAAGKWYPIFGIGSDGWLNKGSQADINKFYGSPVLKQIAAQLDAQIGKPAEGSIIKVSPRAVQESVNRGLESIGVAPSENKTPNTKRQVTDNIAKVLGALPASLDTPTKPKKSKPVTTTKKAKKVIAPPLAPAAELSIEQKLEEHTDMLAAKGFPVRLSSRYSYGAPKGFTKVKGGLAAASEALAQKVQDLFPATDREGTLATFPPTEQQILRQSPIKKVDGFRSWTDPTTGKSYTKADSVEVLYSPYTGVAFDNSPVRMAAALRAGLGPIGIPVGFDKSKLNKAFVINAAGDSIIDVEAVDPQDPSIMKSMVTDGKAPKLPTFSEIGGRIIGFLTQVEPPADTRASFRNVQLLTKEAYKELQDIMGIKDADPSEELDTESIRDAISTEGSILDGSYTYAEARAILDQFFHGVYPHVVESKGKKEYASVGTALRRLLNISSSGLDRGSEDAQSAASLAMAEVYAEVMLALKTRFIVSHLFGSDLAQNAKGEYQIPESHLAEMESFFSDTELQDSGPALLGKKDSSRLPTETKRQRIAVAILNSKWESGKLKKSITEPNSKPARPVEGWENIVLESFLRESLADSTVMGNSLQAIDLIPAIRRARNRIHQAARDVRRESQVQGRGREVSFDEGRDTAQRADEKETTYDDSSDDVASPSSPYSTVTAEEATEAHEQALTIADAAYKYIESLDKRSTEHKRAQKALVGVVAEASGGVVTRLDRALSWITSKVDPALQEKLNEVQGDIPLEILKLLHLRGYPTKRTLDSPDAAALNLIAERSNLEAYAASTAAQADAARAENGLEIQRLGLVDGDPASVIKALQKIAAESDNEMHREVAKILLANPALINSLDFRIVDAPFLDAAGLYSDGVAVTVNIARLASSGIESTILHEYLHAATYDLLNRPADQLSPAQRTARKRLEAILKQARQEYQANYINKGRRDRELEHGLQSLDELVAMSFTSPRFQNLLQQLSPTNFFEKILRVFKKLFRIPDTGAVGKAFDALVDLTADARAYGYSSSVAKTYDGIGRALHELKKRAVPEEIANGLRSKTFTQQYVETRSSSFEPLFATSNATPEQQQMLDLLITDAVNLAVPNDIPVRVVNDPSEKPDVFAARPNAAVVAAIVEIDGVRQTVVFINRSKFREALHERANVIESPVQALHIAEAVLAEEVAHVAEFHTIPTEEVDALADKMPDHQFDDIIDSYTQDGSLRAELKAKVREGDSTVKRQMIGEFLRMKVQRITRGYTSEADIRFYSDNPSMVSMFKRFLTRVFRRMYARFKLRSENPEIAFMVNKMARELHLMQNGRLKSRRLSFDPNNPDESFRVLDQRFSALLADVSEETTEDEIRKRFSNMFDVLEFPVGLFEKGEYKRSKYSLLTGNLDWRIRELKKFEEMFGRMIDSYTKARVNKVGKLRDEFPDISDAQIQAVLGRSDAVDVSEEIIQIAEANFNLHMEDINSQIRAGDLPAEAGSEAARNNAYDLYVTQTIAAERKRLLDEFLKERDAALNFIRSQSPDLAQALIELRDTVDVLSIKMKDAYGLDGELSATVQANVGVYVTRSYRAFTEDGYIDMMIDSNKRTPEMQAAYDAVYPFFLENYRKQRIKTLLEEDAKNRRNNVVNPTAPRLTRKEAERQTDLSLKNENFQPVHDAMAAYLRDITGEYDMYRLEAGATKALLDNLKRRENLPKAFRDFLGEHSEETALTNVVRTIATLTRMTGRQTFFNHMIQLGHDPEGGNGFLMTHEEIQRRMVDDPSLKNWRNIRTGREFSKDATETGRRVLEAKEDRTFLYYGPPEMVVDMTAQFQTPVLKDEQAKHQYLIDAGANVARTVTGVALTTKTLFSVGFYVRNIVGNLGFFQLGQGMINYKYTAKEMLGQLKRGVPFTDDAQATDEIRAELISLGIVGGDISSNLLREILHKGYRIEDAHKELEERAAEFDKLKDVSKSAVAKAKGSAKAGMTRLLALSEAVDAFYKIGYFMHELQVLRDAAAANPDGRYGQMDELTLKRVAAQKVRETSQSYQDAPEFIRSVSQRFGFLLAPFLRFRTDIIRIAINTVKLGTQEIREGNRDNNSVIRSRGIKRLMGFATVYGGVGMLGSVGLRMLLGIGEEEDEMYRQTVPEYKKNNTFFFIKGKDGVLTAYDLTFVNPMSPLSDPLLRAGEQIARGNPSRAIEQLVGGIWSEYTDTQIFTQAAMDVKNNKDARTGKKIYDERAGIEKIIPMLGYIWRESYEPRTLRAAINMVQSARSGPLPDPSKSPLALLLNEIKPTRGYRIDPENMFQRYLEAKRDERNAARSSINILKSDVIVSDSDIEDAFRNYIETSRNVDAEIRQSIIAAQKFGLSPESALGVMSQRYLGMGKRRQANIIAGFADRPMLQPEYISDVLEKGEAGVRRLLKAQEVFNSYPPVLLLTDE